MELISGKDLMALASIPSLTRIMLLEAALRDATAALERQADDVEHRCGWPRHDFAAYRKAAAEAHTALFAEPPPPAGERG